MVKKPTETRGRARLHELWQIFADESPASPWLAGERLGALDILAATVSKSSGARKALAESRPGFAALPGASMPAAHCCGAGRRTAATSDAPLAAAPDGRAARRGSGSAAPIVIALSATLNDGK